VNKIKKLTGDDPVSARRIYEGKFDFVNSAKLIFAVNEPPMFNETGRQIERRLRYVEFPHTFTDDDDGNPDKVPPRELKRELTNNTELSGLLNRALEVLGDLRDRGEFAHVGDPTEHVAEYEERADPIARFADECLRNTSDSCVLKSAVYNAYVSWCDENDETSKIKRTFYPQLERTEITVDESRVKVNRDGDRKRVFSGVALTPAGRDACSPEVLDKSDDANTYRNGTDATVKATRTDEEAAKAEASPGYPTLGKEGPNGASQDELIRDIREVIRSLPAPDVDMIAAVLAREGYDHDRVLNHVKQLRVRGQLAPADGGGLIES
jgi:phage/plasmid-associated DNA primase